ncbi:MAG: aminoacyl-tRNA hydrolase [Deltaproteobacteria bacterium RIFCSPLOWO2_01_44_7]|nr:MAG: aminoacyl-tRNA hydrolase [Deltaproteobacteria bacterium RIFCSPHIGHO2_01_FULL_43_49]OGQ15905.1 MAG: aminoacyl-tRNA hydrolase [Deltaproteobacteria bacterium RIFCSPHIGHO2_02_FULL_44_53]OGQ28868.1 MAG: aminoacyl-tRNA hydrolase [Deltaproteobacteria bacterium RIFCSPHIGHO2_12_FULL_44_21]OGQ30960.1 MAG: aminoacyl-tRNA hydrolase [Deltaproteobacteria bacterium RIFCSPLOWO2_01_FULL_45_74]OGQ40202.1 MAG: aminoacyl-tRNA hydrolase [Deltaproteobacteria bacterium RIFCSPLOWO2_01_44_7]OGQ43466.1 MAG: ami
MKLIVGLGNPGHDYANHKHNIGFWMVDELAKSKRWKWEKNSRPYEETWGDIEGQECYLVKPLTWMNLSGQAVKALLKEKKADTKDLIVVHDDIDLALGKMRWSFGSGSGGHNGVKSIIEQLGTQDFHRIRLGIGRPPAHGLLPGTHVDPAEYVLEPFSVKELEVVEGLVSQAVQSIPDFLKHGLQWVQNRYH